MSSVVACAILDPDVAMLFGLGNVRRIKESAHEIERYGPEHDDEESVEAPVHLGSPGKLHPPVRDEHDQRGHRENHVHIIDAIPPTPVKGAADPGQQIRYAEPEDEGDENENKIELTHSLRSGFRSLRRFSAAKRLRSFIGRSSAL